MIHDVTEAKASLILQWINHFILYKTNDVLESHLHQSMTMHN